ncbi:phage holin family protein [Citrobacter portucalensis]|uniref:HP1 family phage holin n=1 Tax=Citrobacter portucalensis TaxID=1639133 RepID=UPI00226BBD62|nr:HP1 family phage holin [Citrobacter portucalensis]MCX9038816.1 phage holin family protein [Citrobacter portucalensis]
MNTEKIMAAVTYFISLLLATVGRFSLQDAASVVGMVLGCCTFAVYWYYRRKTFRLLASGAIDKEIYERANR